MTTHPTLSYRRASAHPGARHLLVAAALAALAVASPATAHGQQQPDWMRNTVSATATATANALDARAAAYELSFGDPRELLRAAELHERAARLRAPSDSLGTASLQLAAFGRYYADERDAAGELMEAAAERAAAMGDVLRAVDAFIDAAAIALELGQRRHARALVEKATVLTGSPLLNTAQRQKLLARVAVWSPPATVTAAVVRR